MLEAWTEYIESEHGPIALEFRPSQPECVQTNGVEVCDTHTRCYRWRMDGECQDNYEYMRKHCPISCPDPNGCVNCNKKCEKWAADGECDNNAAYMNLYCPVACGFCDAPMGRRRLQPGLLSSISEADIERLQTLSETFGVRQDVEGMEKDKTLATIEASAKYMEHGLKDVPQDIRERCLNRHALCSFWAVVGECEENEAYMTTNCAPACQTCQLIDFETRCPKLDDLQPALQPGDLHNMFTRIVATAPGNRTLGEEDRRQLTDASMPTYTVAVYSGPDESASAGNEMDIDADGTVAAHNSNDKESPPWVVVFDNFLTDEECDAMIQLGYKYEYKRSEDVGTAKFDGSYDSVKSEGRTSENAWCTKACREEDIPQRIHERIASILDIPAVNSEDFQILKYEKGQFYRTHHDYIPNQRDRQCGPRILTFFLYLNDVPEGGGTNFPLLDLTVEPKRGRALLWPSVLSSDPMEIDPRMDHQALEVIEGTKFAANGWIHMYDYITPQEKGCT